MHQKIKQYKKNLKLKRHESGDRWYSPEDLNMWRPSVTTIIGNTVHKGIGFEMWLGNHPSYKIACEERDAAASRGTEVHELAERYMLGDEVSGSTDEVNKHLMSFEKFWLEKEVQLDTKTVKEFINQIFGLIVANASRNVAKSIMTEILDKVIIPFNTQNRISGDDFTYEPESEEVMKTIGDKNGNGK